MCVYILSVPLKSLAELNPSKLPEECLCEGKEVKRVGEDGVWVVV